MKYKHAYNYIQEQIQQLSSFVDNEEMTIRELQKQVDEAWGQIKELKIVAEKLKRDEL